MFVRRVGGEWASERVRGVGVVKAEGDKKVSKEEWCVLL